jgi:metal-sulfur cluster biosynthetic enzyme
MMNKKDIIEIIQTCYDPEIPVDLWNLGLIYNIEINNDVINITMTLTTPGCSMAESIAEDLKTKLLYSNKIKTVNLDITFNPPWEPNMMSVAAKEQLGFKIKTNKDENKNWE